MDEENCKLCGKPLAWSPCTDALLGEPVTWRGEPAHACCYDRRMRTTAGDPGTIEDWRALLAAEFQMNPNWRQQLETADEARVSVGEVLKDLRDTYTSAGAGMPKCGGCGREAGPSFVVNDTPTGPLCNACFGGAWKASQKKVPRQVVLNGGNRGGKCFSIFQQLQEFIAAAFKPVVLVEAGAVSEDQMAAIAEASGVEVVAVDDINAVRRFENEEDFEARARAAGWEWKDYRACCGACSDREDHAVMVDGRWEPTKRVGDNWMNVSFRCTPCLQEHLADAFQYEGMQSELDRVIEEHWNATDEEAIEGLQDVQNQEFARRKRLEADTVHPEQPRGWNGRAGFHGG